MALRDALQAELAAAIQRRDRAVASAARTALSALANGKAVPTESAIDTSIGTEQIAGASSGLGSTEARRMALSIDQERQIVAAERAELLHHADRLTRLCRLDEADAARRAAGALSGVLDAPG
jgi:uncharacterized protein